MKKKFRVWAKTTEYVYIDVEAKDKEEAVAIAEVTDGGEFQAKDLGDWEVQQQAQEIDDEGKVIE